MKKLPSDIHKWNKRWGTDVQYCFPSGGGAVGVMFIFTERSRWVGANGSQGDYEPKDAAFVIKPIQGSAAPTKFAERVLSKVAGAQSPNSVPVKRGTIHFQSIINMMLKFRSLESNSRSPNATRIARWNYVFSNYQNADALLIQETQQGIQELGDAYKPDAYKNNKRGIEDVLTNQTLMINLGKLFAADALIGNGDRLSNMNSGNIVFKADGTISSIDSATILTNYDTIVKDKTNLATGLMAKQTQHWVTGHIQNSTFNANPTPAQQQAYTNDNSKIPVLAPGAGIGEIFDVDTWWRIKFRRELESKLQQHSPNESSPTENIWAQAKIWFQSGVTEGIRQIDIKLSGINWYLMKNKYKSYISKYGGDPNLDWMNFKIRRKYVKLINKGKSEAEAIKEIQNYAARKTPGL